jgi:hypothetical protein
MALVTLENSVQVSFNRTIVGWFNVSLVDADYKREMVTLSPKQFFEVFDASEKVGSGCCELPINQAQSIGFQLEYRWEKEAVSA